MKHPDFDKEIWFFYKNTYSRNLPELMEHHRKKMLKKEN